MLTVDNMRERGVKNQGKHADVLYGRPLAKTQQSGTPKRECLGAIQ